MHGVCTFSAKGIVSDEVDRHVVDSASTRTRAPSEEVEMGGTREKEKERGREGERLDSIRKQWLPSLDERGRLKYMKVPTEPLRRGEQRLVRMNAHVIAAPEARKMSRDVSTYENGAKEMNGKG